MRVTVRWFAVLRERRGVESEIIEVEPGLTLAELYRRLVPPGPEGALPVAFARNLAYAEPSDRFDDGDELAFLPPLGGG
jgi:molybdopterin converting factor small subunit